MSRNLEEAKLSVISDIKKIFNDNKYPMLPIDESPIQGDISIICFPGAKQLKKSPERVAKNVSEIISHIELIKETAKLEIKKIISECPIRGVRVILVV